MLGEKEELCIDRPLYEECLAICRLRYLDCLSSCDSSLCHSTCLANFSACDNSCPCGTDCPTGCVECEEHPLCIGKCADAEQNNPEYKSCLNDSLDELTACMKTCEPTDTCHENCCSGHRERMTACPCFQSQGTSSTTSPPTTQQPLDPSEMSILVLRYSISDAYVISGDGNSKVSATITAPADDYAKWPQHALIGNQLFIFGGYSDRKKIAVLEGCNFEQRSEKLLNDIDYASAALSIHGNSRVLICFSAGSNKKHCEIFDGSSSTSTTSSNYGHGLGRLGLYKNQATTVGSYYDTPKVETLTNNGWSVIGDPPISGTWGHVLVGLQSGNLLMLGGVMLVGGSRLDHVWLLSNDSWSRTGTLKNAIDNHSSLQINGSIFLIPGYGVNYPLERVDMDEDEIKSSEIIGNHSGTEDIPVLFQVSAGFCT
ncbi:Oidioi.mRNA.OKI2018_I69.chr2.g5405.t1.cds [Oikopleura dioica]|uniref:Oidioi.mRNA.OKI2018_I69.chr2.g5405.t1.cds n=1 Tax=Oikopleura dioica TaxID=34765 RepID=A0ABN7T3K9_OIKDI|nr:Oidioi.mRNA.OKI2018_I69.chr2.g5405.t1.cds [Oikopleura dioica]